MLQCSTLRSILDMDISAGPGNVSLTVTKCIYFVQVKKLARRQTSDGSGDGKKNGSSGNCSSHKKNANRKKDDDDSEDSKPQNENKNINSK